MLLAIESARDKVNIFNLGTDEYCEVNDSIRWICAHLGLKPNKVTTGFGVELSGLAAHRRTPTPSASEPFRKAIGLSLSRSSNAMAIWQDLVADSGFSSSY